MLRETRSTQCVTTERPSKPNRFRRCCCCCWCYRGACYQRPRPLCSARCDGMGARLTRLSYWREAASTKPPPTPLARGRGYTFSALCITRPRVVLTSRQKMARSMKHIMSCCRGAGRKNVVACVLKSRDYGWLLCNFSVRCVNGNFARTGT